MHPPTQPTNQPTNRPTNQPTTHPPTQPTNQTDNPIVRHSFNQSLNLAYPPTPREENETMIAVPLQHTNGQMKKFWPISNTSLITFEPVLGHLKLRMSSKSLKCPKVDQMVSKRHLFNHHFQTLAVSRSRYIIHNSFNKLNVITYKQK